MEHCCTASSGETAVTLLVFSSHLAVSLGCPAIGKIEANIEE